MKSIVISMATMLLLFSCKEGKKESDTVQSDKPNYEEIGMRYAQETQKVLGKNLKGTIQDKGVAEAVVFCNERAYPLTDSMAIQYDARIKRVSDKTRNPLNKANATELAHINTFKKQIAAGDSIVPIVQEKDGQVHFYYPIVTNALCLNCHGTPNQNITPEVVEHLSELYPEDEATGYGIDEVRGIWSIVFEASDPSK
ncbi:DUF3365 domain-containing protein [Muricauda sp. MAR_2010_75]|jgi:hypothetical protein|uniref:Tll0287-like domain-containing protein n=1 Tax=Allomuricauda sp. MAR_2010_75 TaxID=1250232 RepID=UPI00068FC79A|nr:DUF3365 domain-containing protein [Muricauda sp. MAR_2010_75]